MLTLLTFDYDTRLFQLTVEDPRRIPFEVPLKGFVRYDEKKWSTRSHQVAARLRKYADASAEHEIQRVMITVTPWPGRIRWPKNLTPKKFQINAAKWCLAGNRRYLAGAPGIGKSIIASLMINALHLKKMPTVVLCPPFLVPNLKAEFTKWCPWSKLEIYNNEFWLKDEPFDLLLLPDNYLARNNRASQAEVMEHLAFERMALIVDEAHRYKEGTTARTQALLGQDAFVNAFEKVILMSGTPNPNGRPIELYPTLKRLAPETIDFRDRIEFGLRYCKAHQDERGHWNLKGANRTEEFAEKLTKKFMLRIRKEDVLKDLPERLEEIVILSDTLPVKLASLDAALTREWEPDELTEAAKRSARPYKPNSELGEMATYRMQVGIAKTPLALEYIRDILDYTEETLLVFAHHKEVIRLLKMGLAIYGPLVIDGSVLVTERFAVAELFQNTPSNRLVIINTQVGGVGLNLTKADRALFVECSWVPGENQQAIDRIHRYGREGKVLAQYLMIENSMDKRVLESNLRKRKTAL